MEEGINKALTKLRPALAADGFELRLESVNADDSVTVALEAKPDACMECLVPDEVLVSILEQAIRDEMPSLNRVVLAKYNFEAHS